MSEHECDCGNPATRKDGSGWYCDECGWWVNHISKLVNQLIHAQRGDQMFESRIKMKREKYLRHKYGQ